MPKFFAKIFWDELRRQHVALASAAVLDEVPNSSAARAQGKLRDFAVKNPEPPTKTLMLVKTC